MNSNSENLVGLPILPVTRLKSYKKETMGECMPKNSLARIGCLLKSNTSNWCVLNFNKAYSSFSLILLGVGCICIKYFSLIFNILYPFFILNSKSISSRYGYFSFPTKK